MTSISWRTDDCSGHHAATFDPGPGSADRYYDLGPALAAALDRLGLTTLERSGRGQDDGGDVLEIASHWLAASSDTARLAALTESGWKPATPADHPFTDDYADILTYLHIGP